MTSHRDEEGWSTIFRLAKLAGAILVIGALIAVFYPKYNEYAELQRRKEALQMELQLEQEALRVLVEKQQLLQTKADFAERVAREEFGLAKPGERVIKFLDAEPAPTRTNAP